LHAGDPLLSGTRYIIAVFILINDNVNNDNMNNINNNKMKDKELNQIDNQSTVFKKQKVELNNNQGSFCFNFDEL
jgi:hypothetical protein